MEYLEIIQRVMDQHKVVLGQFDSISATMSDRDALFRMEKAQAEMVVDFKRTLGEKRSSLIELLATVDRGLKNHYAFEEEMLPPLLGKLLTEALVIEHKNLTSEMKELISIINDAKLKDLSYGEEMSQDAITGGMMRKLRDNKLDHLTREEAILSTLQRLLEEQARPGQAI
jgi:hypothetical protein